MTAFYFYGLDQKASAKSNGHLIFWDLYRVAISLGYQAYPVLPGEFVSVGDSDICVYTDSCLGNPLCATNVVRYFLAKPLSLSFGADLERESSPFGPRDLLLSYSSFVDSLLPQYFFLSDNFFSLSSHELLLTIPNIERFQRIAVYYGKTFLNSGFFSLPSIRSLFPGSSILPLTRFSPASKDQLYSELSSSDLLVTFDPLTSLISESLIIGTPVWIVDDIFRSAYTASPLVLEPVFYDLPSLGIYNASLKRYSAFMRSVIDAENSKVSTIGKMLQHCVHHFSLVDQSRDFLGQNTAVNQNAWSRYKESSSSMRLAKGITLPRLRDVGFLSVRFWIAFLRLLVFRLRRFVSF